MRFLSVFIFLLFSEILGAQQRIAGQVIVQLDNAESFNEFQQTFPDAKTQLLSKSWNVWLLTFPQGEEERMLNAIRKAPQVIVAQFNHRISKRSTIPNDSLFTSQWSLDNTGQGGGTPDADIDAPEAWDSTTSGVTALGDTIVVAIVDDGVDLQHEDLRFWKNRNDPHNGIDDDLNGYIDDYNGWNAKLHSDSISPDYHGTHIGGIAAAIGNNHIGITGVAWNARILPVSLFEYSESEVVEAYSYIFDTRKNYNLSGGAEGAFVVAANSSFGIDFGKPQDFPLWCAMYDSLGSVGVLSVASTMNQTVDVEISGDVPCTCTSDYLITVTNTTRYDEKWTASAFGYTSIDLGAPGTGILSTIPGNGYVFSSGTSMSAPHVTGAIAVLYGLPCPDLQNLMHSSPEFYAQLMKRYILSGTDILSSLDGITVSGGRLNLFNSVKIYYNECISCLKDSQALSMISCHGSANGVIAVTASEGIAPYHFQWSTGDTLNSISGLDRGKYSVTITDANGCVKSGFYEIKEPFALVANVISDSAINGENGTAAVFVSGGVMPYSYLWDDSFSSTTPVLNGLGPGNYTVTITDANQCTAIRTITVGNIVGIHSISANLNGITLSPNPVREVVWIEFSSSLRSPAYISVFDISGKLLLEKKITNKKTPLDFSALPPGNYWVKILSDKTVMVKKITRL